MGTMRGHENSTGGRGYGPGAQSKQARFSCAVPHGLGIPSSRRSKEKFEEERFRASRRRVGTADLSAFGHWMNFLAGVENGEEECRGRPGGRAIQWGLLRSHFFDGPDVDGRPLGPTGLVPPPATLGG